MTRLLDNHPQLSVHPLENYFGRPYKYHLPDFDPQSPPDLIWRQLRELPFCHARQLTMHVKNFRIRLNAAHHYRRFVDQFPSNPDYANVCHHYFQSFIASLTDYPFVEQPKYCVYFTPRQALYTDEIIRCFPGSRVVQVIRHPLGFYNSTKVHNRFYDITSIKFVWRLFFFNALDLLARGVDGYHPVIFETLLAAPEPMMRKLAEQWDISYDPSLTTPTYGGAPWGGDSNFRKRVDGIDASIATHHTKHVSPEETAAFAEDAAWHEQLTDTLARGKPVSDMLDATLSAYLETFRKYMTLYRSQKPVNTKAYIFHPEAEPLYAALLGDQTSVPPRVFFAAHHVSEVGLLKDTFELSNTYTDDVSAALPDNFLTSRIEDAESTARFIVALLDGQPPAQAVAYLREQFDTELRSQVLARAIEIVTQIDQRNFRFTSYQKLITTVRQSGIDNAASLIKELHSRLRPAAVKNSLRHVRNKLRSIPAN